MFDKVHPGGELGTFTRYFELLEQYGITPKEADELPKKFVQFMPLYKQVIQELSEMK